ncbi:MAG: S49 family peptidase, partial [Melioribacteraceae bacterium]|nr:S49 family peptidase [Melioribacteraceae bacterium]
MKQFFKFLFASILGFFISLFILVFIFFIFSIALVSSFSKTETVSISDNTILELRLDYDLPERSSYEPVNFSGIPRMSRTLGLNDLVKLINSAKNDERIKGIFIDLDNLRIGGLAKINTIRESLKDFKTSSKYIIAHGNSISERAFYLASVADSLYLTPTGTIEFDGFGMELTFFKGTLDKLDIEPQVFQYGKFKGSTEPFKLDKLSVENELQLSQYLNSVYNNFLEKISVELKIEKDSLRRFANNALINSAEDAKNHGFVNGLLYLDQVDSIMYKMSQSNNIPEKLSYKKYFYSSGSNSLSSDNRIAVIYALGEITNGIGNEYTIGTKNIIES